MSDTPAPKYKQGPRPNRFPATITPQQKSRLLKLKERTGLALSDQIRRAIDIYLDIEEAKYKER